MVSSFARGLMVLWLAAAALPCTAQDAIRSEPVALAAAQPKTIADTIGGFETVLYQVPLQAGETLEIALASNNLSNCFELFAPGAAKPFFLSEVHGNRHSFRATAAGEYTVKVFLLRLAARDYQYAQYSLTLSLQPVSAAPVVSGPDGH